MAQHVTFFKMNVQPGKADDLIKLMSGNAPAVGARGFERSIAGKSKDNPDEVWVAVTWDTSERYYANAESPEQNAQYEKMRALLTADPEWHDCDVLTEETA
jgi:heme-degrading monooxygenase HmoA